MVCQYAAATLFVLVPTKLIQQTNPGQTGPRQCSPEIDLLSSLVSSVSMDLPPL